MRGAGLWPCTYDEHRRIDDRRTHLFGIDKDIFVAEFVYVGSYLLQRNCLNCRCATVVRRKTVLRFRLNHHFLQASRSQSCEIGGIARFGDICDVIRYEAFKSIPVFVVRPSRRIEVQSVDQIESALEALILLPVLSAVEQLTFQPERITDGDHALLPPRGASGDLVVTHAQLEHACHVALCLCHVCTSQL